MTGIIILAAGSSSRLGKPKQNLGYEGRTLLQRAVESAIATNCGQVIVVLGANADVIKPTIVNYKVTIVENDGWEEGMASSIRKGLNKVKDINAKINAVLLMLCDQPHADTDLLNHLLDTHAKCDTDITSCIYNEIIGVPAVFSNTYFDELLLLNGQEGARKLLIKYAKQIATVPFPRGGIDIDTLDDYDRLNS